MNGKRFPDGEWVAEPGGYSKHQLVDGDVYWLVWPPTAKGPCMIGKPNADGSAFHWVRENEDGTITVEPNPPDAPPERRNSNSILYGGWHGYIHDGVWRSV